MRQPQRRQSSIIGPGLSATMSALPTSASLPAVAVLAPVGARRDLLHVVAFDRNADDVRDGQTRRLVGLGHAARRRPRRRARERVGVTSISLATPVVTLGRVVRQAVRRVLAVLHIDRTRRADAGERLDAAGRTGRRREGPCVVRRFAASGNLVVDGERTLVGVRVVDTPDQRPAGGAVIVPVCGRTAIAAIITSFSDGARRLVDDERARGGRAGCRGAERDRGRRGVPVGVLAMLALECPSACSSACWSACSSACSWPLAPCVRRRRCRRDHGVGERKVVVRRAVVVGLRVAFPPGSRRSRSTECGSWSDWYSPRTA